jgi:hypothetical protein
VGDTVGEWAGGHTSHTHVVQLVGQPRARFQVRSHLPCHAREGHRRPVSPLRGLPKPTVHTLSIHSSRANGFITTLSTLLRSGTHPTLSPRARHCHPQPTDRAGLHGAL